MQARLNSTVVLAILLLNTFYVHAQQPLTFRKYQEEDGLSHLRDESFGIPELCKEMAISRSQLHRKLKALTGKSTSLILRSIRLEEARYLLRRPELSISEIAYQVGFGNPNYFSTVFSDFYGVSPTEMREQLSLNPERP